MTCQCSVMPACVRKLRKNLARNLPATLACVAVCHIETRMSATLSSAPCAFALAYASRICEALIMLIAALYVDATGHYPKMPHVDAWDVTRDARLYAGPYPVVAHPPCQLWVNYAALNYKRYGGEHNRPGNDGGCFAHALWAVRRFGGVLEHPAFSNAWAAHGLIKPNPKVLGWQPAAHGHGWVCEVWQSAYGHKARKRTWLYYFGTQQPLAADWRRQPGTHQVGWFDRIKPTLSKKEASATPSAFANYLIALARHSKGNP